MPLRRFTGTVINFNRGRGFGFVKVDRAFTDLLREWSKNDGRPKTTADLVKERAATETNIKLENLKNGLPADYVEHAASTVGDSHLDRFKSGQGKGGSANFGYNRNAMRGAVLQPKVPSER